MRVPAGELAVGSVHALDLDGEEFVVWRGVDGRVRSAPRRCPHLDHDLADGYVAGTELVCSGHGWAFDGDGRTYKRNEWGRVDPKGEVARLDVTEHDGIVELERR